MVMAVMEARAAANAAARAGKGSRQTPGKPPPAKFSEYKGSELRESDRARDREEGKRKETKRIYPCVCFVLQDSFEALLQSNAQNAITRLHL